MALAAHLINAAHHPERLIEAHVLVHGQQRSQFLAGERMVFADTVPVDNDELAVGWDRDTSCLASCCGAMATVSAVRCCSSSHMTRRNCAFSSSLARYPPSF